MSTYTGHDYDGPFPFPERKESTMTTESPTTGTETTFLPSVTLTEQPDGSFVATVDWTSSVTSCVARDGTELDYDVHPTSLAASEALDAFIAARPSMRGFGVPRVQAK